MIDGLDCAAGRGTILLVFHAVSLHIAILPNGIFPQFGRFVYGLQGWRSGRLYHRGTGAVGLGHVAALAVGLVGSVGPGWGFGGVYDLDPVADDLRRAVGRLGVSLGRTGYVGERPGPGLAPGAVYGVAPGGDGGPDPLRAAHVAAEPVWRDGGRAAPDGRHRR